MEKARGINFIDKVKKTTVVLFVVCSIVIPQKSYAGGCVGLAGAEATFANSAIASINAAITGMTAELTGTITSFNKLFVSAVEPLLLKYQYAFLGRLKFLGTQLIEDGLKPIAIQISSSRLAANLQTGKYQDAAVSQGATVLKQVLEYRSNMKHKPSPQDYRFDSKAKFLKLGERVSITAGSSFAQMFADLGSNEVGSDTENASIGLLNRRWELYKKFCDPKANNGKAGCDKESSDIESNLHVMPSKTIFANDTIDFANEPHMLDALGELFFNVTGYRAASSISVAAVGSSSSMDNLLENRSYTAQMDAVGSMLHTIVAERLPISKEETGEVNAVYDTRLALGVAYPSETPSLYETRKTFMEELWTPEYYMDLMDNSNTIERKEIYLQAYGLMMLNKIIERQEKISNAYAIETANMLSNYVSRNNDTGVSNLGNQEQ